MNLDQVPSVADGNNCTIQVKSKKISERGFVMRSQTNSLTAMHISGILRRLFYATAQVETDICS